MGSSTREYQPGRGLDRHEDRSVMDAAPRGVRALEGDTLVEGDRVRLKFLYPNGSLEVLECTWVATTSLGAPENPSSGWVVVSTDDRILWKPLSHLIQLEVVEPNGEARQVRRQNGGLLDRYHG